MARFGVRLDIDPQIGSQEHRELASLAEKSGYETVWVPEGAGRDALTQLTAVAMTTRHLKLGTGIMPVFSRTPMLTAMTAAGLAAVSQGRFILGLGVGHRPAVENGHGVIFRRPLTRLRETVAIVRRLLRGESVTHQGRVFKVRDAGLGGSAPAEPVPIYIPEVLECQRRGHRGEMEYLKHERRLASQAGFTESVIRGRDRRDHSRTRFDWLTMPSANQVERNFRRLA